MPVERTASGKWEARWREPGKRNGKSRVFRTKGEALRFLADIESSKAHGTDFDPNVGRGITLADWWSRYVGAAVAHRPSTRSRYEGVARSHILPHLGGRLLSSLSQAEVKAWLATLQSIGVGTATVNQAHRVLRAALNAAVDAGLLGRNPAARVKAPKPARSRHRILTPDEVRFVTEAMPERYRELVYVMAYAGLRIGEATALSVENLDLLRGRLRVERAYTEVRQALSRGAQDQDESGRCVAAARRARLPVAPPRDVPDCRSGVHRAKRWTYSPQHVPTARVDAGANTRRHRSSFATPTRPAAHRHRHCDSGWRPSKGDSSDGRTFLNYRDSRHLRDAVFGTGRGVGATH